MSRHLGKIIDLLKGAKQLDMLDSSRNIEYPEEKEVVVRDKNAEDWAGVEDSFDLRQFVKEHKNLTENQYIDVLTGKIGNEWRRYGRDMATNWAKEHNTPTVNEKAYQKLNEDVEYVKNTPTADYDSDMHGNALDAVDTQNLLLQHFQLTPKIMSDAVEEGNVKVMENPSFGKNHLYKMIEKHPEHMGEYMHHEQFDSRAEDMVFGNEDTLKGLSSYDIRTFVDKKSKGYGGRDGNQVSEDYGLDMSPRTVHAILEHAPEKVTNKGMMNVLLDHADPTFKKQWTDKMLGITDGEYNHDDPEHYDTDEDFQADNWDNWTEGEGFDHKVANMLAGSRHLDNDQAEHIKRHGEFDDKYELYQNEHVDPKHGAEMFQKWYDSTNEHGYDADELNEKHKDDKDDIFTVDDLSPDTVDEIVQGGWDNGQIDEAADENYTFSDYLDTLDDTEVLEAMGQSWDNVDEIHDEMYGEHDWKGENPESAANQGNPVFEALDKLHGAFEGNIITPEELKQHTNLSPEELGLEVDSDGDVDGGDVKTALDDHYGGPSMIDFSDSDNHRINEHPDYDERYEDAANSWRINHWNENRYDMAHEMDLYEGHRDSEGYQEAVEEARKDYIEENAHEHFDDLYDESHQNTKFIPTHLHTSIPNFAELNEANKKEKADGGNGPFFNQSIKDREYEHAYGDNQHFYEMVKDHAEANGGKIDVGTMNKLYPAQKAKWKEIFAGKGKLSHEEASQKLDEIPKTNYDISYGKWDKNKMQNVNGQNQVIFRLDHSNDSIKPLMEDPKTYETFKHVQNVSKQSGHPTNDNTIAWARVDTTDPEHWMIDEVQSDFGKTVTRYLKEQGADEKAEHIDKISDHHKNWREALTNAVLKEAKKHGAQKVSTHSPESKSQHTGSSKIHSVYKDSYKKVPRAMGFQPAEVEDLPLTDKGKQSFITDVPDADKSVIDRSEKHEEASDFHIAAADYLTWAKGNKAPVGLSDIDDTAFDSMLHHHLGRAQSHKDMSSSMGVDTSMFNELQEGGDVDSLGSTENVIKDRVRHSLVQGFGHDHEHDRLLNEPLPEAKMPEKPNDHQGHTFNLTPKLLKKHMDECLEYLEALEKGEVGRAAKGALLALGMAQGVHYTGSDSAQEASRQFTQENAPKHARSVSSMDTETDPVKQGYDDAKKEANDIVYRNDKEYFLNKYSNGLSPHVYKQTIKNTPELSNKYNYIHSLSNNTFKEVVEKNPNLREDVHSEHYDKLHSQFSGDHEKMLHAWKNGIKSANEKFRSPASSQLGEQPTQDTVDDSVQPEPEANFTYRRMFKSEDIPKPAGGVKINPEHGKTIANAYDQMEHSPNHPEVKKAYSALIDETKSQFHDIMKNGMKLSSIKEGQENPYKNSKELHHDVKNNKHMHFYPTSQGFGSGDVKNDHPMLQGTGIFHEGKELLANDLFRIVHDINGHHKGGESGFGAKGEQQAYNAHKKMYSPLAQKALATETLGQNSWVNFGPHGEHNRKNPAQTKYADQKAGLLPDHIINGNWHSDKGEIKKAEKAAKAIKEVAHEQDMMSDSGRPMPLDHITEDHDPNTGKEDKKVKEAVSNLREDKQSTKNMFQRVYSIPSEDKMKSSKRAKMTGQVPNSINVYGSHFPVVKLINDNTLLLHTSDYGNEGKTQELVKKIRAELPEQFPDYKVIEVHHPDYKHSSKVMRMRNKTGLHKFLEDASENHPDENYRQHAKESLAHLLSLKKGEFSKPIHAKRTENEGYDAEANMQSRTDRIIKYLESVGLTPDIGEGNKRDLGSKSPTSVTINAKGDPKDQQLLHEGGHAMLTPEGASLSEYQTGIGEPGFKGKLHQTQYREELQDSHGGGMPEQTAQQMEAGIARRSGVEPFRSPQRGVSAKSSTEKSRTHAKKQLKMFDAGIYRFDPFSGENELQGDIHAYINAKEMGETELAEKIRMKLMDKIKGKKKMKESGDWEEEDSKLAASEKIVGKKL